MKVRDRMRKRVLTIEESDDLALAVQMMAWGQVRHLPVMRGKELVGMLSEHDILVHLSGAKGAMSDAVSSAMVSPVETAHPDDDYLEVVAHMASQKIGSMPVVDKGAMLGILTVTDVVADRVWSALEPGEHERVSLKQVMTLDPSVVHPDDYLLDAVARMSEYHVRHLPVVDAEKRVVGILADRDVRASVGDPRRALAESEVLARVQLMRVKDVMTTEVVTLRDSDPLSKAIDLFVGKGYGALPVIDGQGRLTGIISYMDALRQLTRRPG